MLFKNKIKRIYLDGFQQIHQIGDKEPPGRSIFTFSSPFLFLILTMPLNIPRARYCPSFVQLRKKRETVSYSRLGGKCTSSCLKETEGAYWNSVLYLKKSIKDSRKGWVESPTLYTAVYQTIICGCKMFISPQGTPATMTGICFIYTLWCQDKHWLEDMQIKYME